MIFIAKNICGRTFYRPVVVEREVSGTEVIGRDGRRYVRPMGIPSAFGWHAA